MAINRKTKIETSTKVGVIDKSLMAIIPKDITNNIEIKKGDQIKWILDFEDETRLTLDIIQSEDQDKNVLKPSSKKKK